jgi:hypothetical protein
MIHLPYEECREHAKKVFAAAKAMGLWKQLKETLYYLHTYANREGCTYDKLQGLGNTRCDLYPDFAPYSFAISMKRQDRNGQWHPWWSGGLIFQGPGCPADGSFPSLTVSLNNKDVGWFVHT